MLFETITPPLIKGLIGTSLLAILGAGGYTVVHRKFLEPTPLQEILEKSTGKKFSRQLVVSKEKVPTFAFKIPAGLSVKDILEIKPAIEDKLDCEIEVWAEDKRFMFRILDNPLPKYLAYNPDHIRKVLARYECGFYFGISRLGDLVLDFTDNATPHLLFAGPTGSGKSNLLNQGICGMMESYLPEEIQFHLIDLKDGVELGIYQGVEHVAGFYENMGEVLEGLTNIRDEITYRNQLFKKKGVKKLSEYNEVAEQKLPRLIVVADEFAQFNNIGDRNLKRDIFTLWETILQKGRSAGIHCILGTQVADADVFPKQIKGNIDARFGFRFTDPQHSRMVTGGSELLGLPNIMGRGLYKIGNKMIQVQTPFIQLSDIIYTIKKYRREVIEDGGFETDEIPMDSIPVEKSETSLEKDLDNLDTLEIDDLFMTEEDFQKKLKEGLKPAI